MRILIGDCDAGYDGGGRSDWQKFWAARPDAEPKLVGTDRRRKAAVEASKAALVEFRRKTRHRSRRHRQGGF